MVKNPFAKFALATSYITIIPLSKLVRIEGTVSGASAVGGADAGIDSLLEQGSGGGKGSETKTVPALDNEILAGLTMYLPAVGMLVGLILCSLSFLLSLGPEAGIRPILNAVIITIAWLVTTGALHFDGLMDTADGIFSHRNRERMLEIMQDSRVGNFGAITGISVFALKVSAMAAISPQALPLALFLTPMWARFAEAYAIAHYKYARPEGKGKVWHDTTKVPRDLLIAVVVPFFFTVLLGIVVSESAYVTAIFAAFSGLAAAAYLDSKLGGHTGDTYGAVVEVSETLTLVGLALLGNNLFR